MHETSRITAITGGTVIDGTGAKPIENAMVIIRDSKIVAVGKGIDIPDGAKIINAAGKTVMPGMIDAHMHYLGKKDLPGLGIRPRELTLLKSINDARGLLRAGFTTTKDCGGRNAIFLRDAVTEGTLTGLPRIVASGVVLAQTFNGLDSAWLPAVCNDVRTNDQGEFIICDGVDECIKGTRYALRYGAEFVKIFASGHYAYSDATDKVIQFNKDELKAVVQTAAQAGKYVSAHCQCKISAKNCLLSGVKTIEHAIGVDEEIIELALQHDAVFVTSLAFQFIGFNNANTASPFYGAWEASVDAYKRIQKSGAILATGTDLNSMSDFPLGPNAIELELLVKYCDFSPLEAITATTKNAAISCFIGDKTGTLEQGKLADIIIIDGDPLSDITILQREENIKMVMLEGKIEVDRRV